MSKLKMFLQGFSKVIKLFGASILFGYASAFISTILWSISYDFGIIIDMSWGAQVILMISSATVFFFFMFGGLKTEVQHPNRVSCTHGNTIQAIAARREDDAGVTAPAGPESKRYSGLDGAQPQHHQP